MADIRLTTEETELAIQIGTELVTILRRKGLDQKMILSRLEIRGVTVNDLASIISNEEGVWIGDRLLGGLTPEIRIAAIEEIIREHANAACHLAGNGYYVRCWGCELSSILVRSIINERNLQVRLATIKAFPLSVRVSGLYKVLFEKDDPEHRGRQIKKRKWRRGISPKVRKAVLEELARTGHQKTLLMIALKAPSRFACRVLPFLDEAGNVTVAKRAEVEVAEVAMKRVTDPALLQKLLKSKRKAVRVAARKKLGLPPARVRIRGLDVLSFFAS